MFDILKRFLGGDAHDKQTTPDPQLAATALLVQIAHSDDDYAEAERARIDLSTARLFDLTPEAAAELRARAEAEATDAVGLHRHTLAVKTAYTPEEREIFMVEAWRVALSDGVREAHENVMMRRLPALLGVDDRASAAARQRAETPEA